MRLKDKAVIITGGGSGIGRATAFLFAEEGATLMLAGRRLEPLKDTAGQIRGKGGTAEYLSVDVSRSDQVKKMVQETRRLFGRIDILYNNAAVFTGNGKTIVDLSEEEWEEQMSVNAKGVFLCCKYTIPHMIEQGGGVIINCSSIAGHIGQRNQPCYHATKGAVEMLTKCTALDFAGNNIRVNAVAPAWIEIDRNREKLKRMKELMSND